MLIKGNIRVKLDENPYLEGMDTSYHEHKYLDVLGTVTEVGQIEGVVFAQEYDSMEYTVKKGVKVGDRVILRWLYVSGSPDFDGEVIVSYKSVIAVDYGELSLRNSFVLIQGNKVINISEDIDWTSEEYYPPKVGEYVITRRMFNVEYVGQYQDYKFTEVHACLVWADEPIGIQYDLI